MVKRVREEFKTLKGVFDLFTEKNIFKLISRGCFEGLESPISIGKEANIFTAINKQGKRVIVKIYRLSTCDFNRMYDYIKADPRFPKLKKNRRQVVFAWAHREQRNLLKAREAGVRVPTPIANLFNILVEEFIGDETPAPKLKDRYPKNPKKFFKQIIESVKKLYNKGIVHGDLSHFNILNYNEIPVFIDMSQSTTLDNPNAIEYLKRDISIICNYFTKFKIKCNKQEIFKKITRKQ